MLPEPRRLGATEGLSSSHDNPLTIPRPLRRRVLGHPLQALWCRPWPSPAKYRLGSLLGVLLPGTLASPRTGLTPAGCRELVARLRRGALLSVVLGARAAGRTFRRNRLALAECTGPAPVVRGASRRVQQPARHVHGAGPVSARRTRRAPRQRDLEARAAAPPRLSRSPWSLAAVQR